MLKNTYKKNLKAKPGCFYFNNLSFWSYVSFRSGLEAVWKINLDVCWDILSEFQDEKKSGCKSNFVCSKCQNLLQNVHKRQSQFRAKWFTMSMSRETCSPLRIERSNQWHQRVPWPRLLRALVIKRLWCVQVLHASNNWISLIAWFAGCPLTLSTRQNIAPTCFPHLHAHFSSAN